jgi:hypothetical protein
MSFKILDFLNQNKKDKYNKRVAELYKKVFGTAAGQEVLADMIMTGFILEGTGGDLIKEGSRLQVLRTLSILNYDPAKFQTTMKKMIEPGIKYPEDSDLDEDED